MISILIPTKDRFFLIKNCLESLLETASGRNVEIVVGDTGSTDKKVFRLYEEMGKRARGPFEVRDLGKYHFSKNNNAMAAAAKGDTLVFLNNDTVALPEWLENLVRPLARPDVAISGAKLLYGYNDRIQHAGVEFLKEGPLQYLGYHPYKDRRPEMPEISYDRFVPAVTGACLAMKKATFEAVGGFDESYREEAQDADLCLKALQKGGRSFFAASSVLYHLENGTRAISVCPHDRQLFVGRWKNLIEEKFFKPKFQSVPADEQKAAWRKRARYVLFLREEARGDVFASTCLAKAYKEKYPDTHLTFKTNHPDLVDGLPFVDRALGPGEPDDFHYDKFHKLTYEDGGWEKHPHTWIEEMARGLRLGPLPDYRPVYEYSPIDEPVRRYYQKRAPYLVMATGAGWKEKEWTPAKWEELSGLVTSSGLEILQVGGSGDYRIRSARHLLDRSLHENLAIVESARAMVTLDSYPLHLGIAARVPLLVLMCKTCAHTGYLPPEAVELRHWEASTTPLPGCRFLGCREKRGVGSGFACSAPILKDLPARQAFAALQILLGNEKAKGGWHGIPANLA